MSAPGTTPRDPAALDSLAPREAEQAVKEARAAYEDARSVVADVERRIREEKQRLASEVDALFRGELRAALDLRAERYSDLRAAQDRTPDHPWTGKRVYKLESVGWAYEKRPQKRTDGVVETMRSTTELPANTASYSRPLIGDGFVRLLKKDGSPSLKFDRLHSWKLAEEEQPPCA